MYHNTNQEEGSTLIASQVQAKTQEDHIYAWFKAHPDKAYTPFEVQQYVNFNGDFNGKWKPPITSIRRAITNLEQQGKLEKTSEMRLGAHGKQNHTWRLKIDRGPVQMRLV